MKINIKNNTTNKSCVVLHFAKAWAFEEIAKPIAPISSESVIRIISALTDKEILQVYKDCWFKEEKALLMHGGKNENVND